MFFAQLILQLSCLADCRGFVVLVVVFTEEIVKPINVNVKKYNMVSKGPFRNLNMDVYQCTVPSSSQTQPDMSSGPEAYVNKSY